MCRGKKDEDEGKKKMMMMVGGVGLFFGEVRDVKGRGP